MQFLFKLHQSHKINIRLILISRKGQYWISRMTHAIEVVHFRSYTFDQTKKIMEKYLKSISNQDAIQIERFMRSKLNIN